MSNFTASIQYTLDDKKWYWLIMHHQQELKFQGVQFQFCKNPGLSWDILRMGLDPEKYHSFGKVLDSLGDEIYFHSKRGTLHHGYTLKTSHKDVPGTHSDSPDHLPRCRNFGAGLGDRQQIQDLTTFASKVESHGFTELLPLLGTWNAHPDSPCREYLPTWKVKNGNIQGEM